MSRPAGAAAVRGKPARSLLNLIKPNSAIIQSKSQRDKQALARPMMRS